MRRLGLCSLILASLFTTIASADKLVPVGDNIAKQTKVIWKNDGFLLIYGDMLAYSGKNKAHSGNFNLKGIQIRVYTEPPLNGPLLHFGAVYDGGSFNHGISGIGKIFGAFNACQKYKNHAFSPYLNILYQETNLKGKSYLNKVINGAQYTVKSLKRDDGTYHLDIAMRYPPGTQAKCSLSQQAHPSGNAQ